MIFSPIRDYLMDFLEVHKDVHNQVLIWFLVLQDVTLNLHSSSDFFLI